MPSKGALQQAPQCAGQKEKEMNTNKLFWSFAFSVLFVVFSVKMVFAEEGEVAGGSDSSDSSSDASKDNKVETCDDIAKCLEKARAQTKRVFTWEKCEAPTEQRIVFEDNKYTVQNKENTARIEQGACVCPDGYELSKSWRMVRTVKANDGTKTEYYKGLGVCLPTNVEPNAEVIAEGLNRLMTFASQTNTRLNGVEGKMAEVMVILNGHAQQIELNAEGVKFLRERLEGLDERVDRHQAILNTMCADQNAPQGVRDLCEAVQRLGRDRQIFRLGATGTYSRYAGRNYVGMALEGGWITPPLSDTSSLRLELGGRLGIGSSSEMKESGNSALGLEGTIYTGPLFDLDDDGQYKLHLRGMGQQLLLMDGFKAMGRRYGGEVAFSFCPKAEAYSQGSFCVVPHMNLAYGDSAFLRAPTEQHPSPPMRGESGATFGAGIGVMGQF